MAKEKWIDQLDEVSPENRELAKQGTLAGEIALHPEKRHPPGIYESGERLWVTPFSRFHSLKCRLFGHRTTTLPLLTREVEQVGEVEWCRTCTSVVEQTRYQREEQ